MVTDFCIEYNIESKPVCEGAVKEMAPFIIENIFIHYTDKDFVCPLLKACPPVYEDIDIDELIQNILKDKPEKKTIEPK